VRFGCRESPVQSPGGVGRKIVQHDADPVRAWVVGIGQIAHADCKITRCAPLCHLHMTPGSVRIEKHEQIGRAIAAIFEIVTLKLTWRGRDRLAHLADRPRRTSSKQTTERLGAAYSA